MADNHKPTTIYYAHPITWYGTDQEAADLDLLNDRFAVINPGSPATVAHAKKVKKASGSKAVMEWFTDKVRHADALAYRTFNDGALGAGVAQEILTAIIHGIPIYQLIGPRSSPTLIPRDPSYINLTVRLLTIDETRARVKENRR